MNIPDWIVKFTFWVLHFFGWLFFNVILGSLPFIQTIFNQKAGDPFQIGLLCFCFSIVSSGLYATIIGFLKVEDSGFTGTVFTALMSLTIFWVISVWSIVLLLPQIIQFIGDVKTIMYGLYLLYCVSIILFFILSYKSLSDIVNSQFSKRSIANTVENSHSDAYAIKSTLEQEDEF